MKRLTLLIGVFILFCGANLYGQTSFKGEVVDGLDKQALANASIVLLNAQDSILVSFTRADDRGRFTLEKPAEGSFLLLVTYPKYGEYNRHIDSDSSDDLGQIALSSISHLIEEVIVTGRIPIVVKGDTTEYDASSFVVEENAKVEDLLRVLPGITVDADGKITAQGKTVEKVLVDGEEFFGDDPTLITRNIRSDMVDKVQVFEKRSEEAERTGVDDGIRQQTINVTLKEDSKRGWFGKAEAAGGADGDGSYYLGKLAANRFNGSQKISAFGMTSNTGDINLNWSEAERFNLSDSEMSTSEDGLVYFMGTSDAFSYWDGRGQPLAFNSGLSFMDAWKDNSQKLNFNYKYGRIQNDVSETTLSQNNLPGGQVNSDNLSNRISDSDRHRFNAKYDWNIDSLTSLTLSLSAGRDGVSQDNFTSASTTDANERQLNDNERLQTTTSDRTNYTYNAYLTRKLMKPGRSLSFRFAGDAANDDGSAFLKSTTNIYQQGILDSTQLIDQMKDIRSTSTNWRTSLAYTEPLTSQLNASINYEYTNSSSHSMNNSYNRGADGSYNVFDEDFSNDFDFNTIRNAANLSLRYKLEKFEANMTNNLRNDALFQRNNYLDREVNRDFLTYNPSLRLRYNITKSQSINLSYTRSNRLPTLSQIQPLRQNTDPLNIVIGNEDLVPSNTNSYNASYNSYNMLKGSYSYFSLSWSQNFNSIQQNALIDPETGIRTSYYENLENHVSNNFSLWGMTSFDIHKNAQIKGDIGGNISHSQYYNYINRALNENQSQNYTLNFSARKSTTKGFDFSLIMGPGWRTMNNSLQPEYNSSGLTFSSSMSYTWHLPAKLALFGTLNYSYEAPTQAFDEKFERILFKPGIRKKFLANESLIAELYVNDAFNQNVGFRRYQSGNMITQNTYNTIARYAMLKISWDFTSMGK